MPSNIASALARVTAALPGGGEARPGQVEMAEAVAAAITEGRHLVVQAGTGTGKSLGYLVPALLSGRRVIVATATKALQDQLAGKDLPFLAEHLGVAFEFALLKGRSNYFCWQKANEAAADSTQLTLEGLTGRHIDAVRELIVWAGSSESGDRAELPTEPADGVWGAVSVSSSECPGKAKCPSGDRCFAEAARSRAALADVIVVNLHLYGQHIASGGFVLPEHDVVILDEAHDAEEIFADGLSIEIGGGRFSHLASRLRSVIADADEAVDLGGAGGVLEGALVPFAGQLLRTGPSSEPSLASALAVAGDRVNKALGVLRNVPDDAGPDVAQRKIRAVQQATGLLSEIHDAAALSGDDTERVAWVESGNRGSSLWLAPVDVAPTLRSRLFDVPEGPTAILTSATIPPNLTERLGMPEHRTDIRDVGSPFDFAQQAMLYCATALPDPRNARYEAAMHEELAALIAAAGGRTLALFTSWRAMKAAHAVLIGRGLPGRLLMQGELPKPALTRAFSEDETSSLFATMGFWQGIDVPGRALTLVTIDKLPFARPDEPLLVARRERAGPAAFEKIDLPRAATLLAQGTGRLIRSSTDRGVVAVLDPRLNSAGYRWALVKALPPMRRTRHRSEVEAFLREITGVQHGGLATRGQVVVVP